jgi:hypothetical protein
MKREQVSDSSPTQPLLSDFSHTDANTMAARDPFADTDSEGVDRRPLDHNGEPVVATWKGRILVRFFGYMTMWLIATLAGLLPQEPRSDQCQQCCEQQRGVADSPR